MYVYIYINIYVYGIGVYIYICIEFKVLGFGDIGGVDLNKSIGENSFGN